MFLVALILLVYAAVTFVVFERASGRLTEWMPREHVQHGPIAADGA